MFRINPHFEQVSDDTMLWRYMPFTRLQSILDTESMFFTKVTTYDDDPFEGSYNKVSEDHYIQWMLSDMPGETIDTVSKEIQQKIYQNLENSLWLSNKFKELVLVSCWHTNDYESVAMWKLYSNYEKGIAIKTTYGRLKHSLENYERPIYGGKLRYIDIRKDRISFGNTLAPYAAKRISFSHEKELRLVTQVEHEKYFEYDWSKENFNNGKLIPCDIKLLIDSIFVSPKCSEEFRLEVQQALKKKGLDIVVQKSDISNIY
jgi:hypothetical protein